MVEKQSERPVELIAKTLHQLYGPSEIEAWCDRTCDREPWRDDARLILTRAAGRYREALEDIAGCSDHFASTAARKALDA